MGALINFVAIEKKMATALKSGKTKKDVEFDLKQRAVNAAFKISANLNAEFTEHPVTQELLAGPDASSSFLPRGNLASFYGLESSRITSQFSQFRSLFKDFNVTVNNQGNSFVVRLKFPPVSRFFDVAEAPDDYGGSWLKKIEVLGGFSKTFAKFLYPFHGPESRSGNGIQTKRFLFKDTPILGFDSIPYISDIYERALGRGGNAKEILLKALKTKRV